MAAWEEDEFSEWNEWPVLGSLASMHSLASVVSQAAEARKNDSPMQDGSGAEVDDVVGLQEPDAGYV
ncbi:MAG: hypothetical protein ABR562_02605 [Thermoplasmatota archaeon]